MTTESRIADILAKEQFTSEIGSERDAALRLLLTGLSREEVSKRMTALYVDQDLYETTTDAKWAATALVDDIYTQLQLVSGADAKTEPIWDSEVLRNKEYTYEELQKTSALKGFFSKDFWVRWGSDWKNKRVHSPAPIKYVQGTDPVTGQRKDYKLLWDEKIGNYVDPDNLGPIYDVVPISDETIELRDGTVVNKAERDFLDGKISYEDAYTLVLVDHLDKHKARFGMFGPDAGAIDESLSGKLFIPGSLSEDTTLQQTGTFSDRLAAAEAAQAERDRIARNLKNYVPGSNKNWLDTGVTQSEYKKRIAQGWIWDKEGILGWMNPTEENKDIIRKEFEQGDDDAKEYEKKNITPKLKTEAGVEPKITGPGIEPKGAAADTGKAKETIKKQTEGATRFEPSSLVTGLPGITGDRALEYGVTPFEVAQGLPSLLPGGTSPFARATYGGILNNLADAFTLVGTAMPEMFSIPDLAGMYGAADDPKAFAKFISQKPEVLKAQIAGALQKLEEVKELYMKDPNSMALQSGTMFNLLSGFIDNPERELKTRMSIAGFGKPKWLRDSIDQRYWDKYNAARITDPASIMLPGFYSNTFDNSPDIKAQNESVTKNAADKTLGDITGSSVTQVEEFKATKGFQPTDVGGQGPDEASMITAASTDPTANLKELKTSLTDTTKTWDDEEWRNPVGAGFYKDRTKTSFTPDPEGSVPHGEGGFIDPTTYNDPRFRKETYMKEGMGWQEAQAMADKAYQNYLAEQRKDMTLVPGSGYSNLGEFQQVIDTPDGGKRIIDTRSPYDVRTPGTYDPVAQPLKPKMGYTGNIPGFLNPAATQAAAAAKAAAEKKAKANAESELDELLLMLGGEGGGPM